MASSLEGPPSSARRVRAPTTASRVPLPGRRTATARLVSSAKKDHRSTPNAAVTHSTEEARVTPHRRPQHASVARISARSPPPT